LAAYDALPRRVLAPAGLVRYTAPLAVLEPAMLTAHFSARLPT